MACVFVSIGSNVDRHRHITAALDTLSQQFGELQLSPVYESEAVGFDGAPFLNLVAGFDTTLTVGELATQLRDIEYAHGRELNAPKFGSRTLDIDILTYADLVGEVDGVQLPREEITENAFVLLPLSQLAADQLHPIEKKSYKQLWEEFAQGSQRLWVISFSWRGEILGGSEA